MQDGNKKEPTVIKLPGFVKSIRKIIPLFKKDPKKGTEEFLKLYETGDSFDYRVVIYEAPASVNHPIDDLKKSAFNRRPDDNQLKKYKKRWEFKTRKLKILGKIPDLSGQKILLKFRFYFKSERKRDHDNYFMAIKGMTDGIFEEDDHQWVENCPPDILRDEKNPRTEILIKLDGKTKRKEKKRLSGQVQKRQNLE